ncbi:hypothetical protein TNCV_4470571 [Trichonephila clavipes]|uniref:Uncharacterized protein n=1 Tax=Trichonephila clavipes TaxID=2585209 RepID=A0A8X6SF45_TRICX|nr:hypothetical protein TNCV_4470571 [Trichonephila clavipes]
MRLLPLWSKRIERARNDWTANSTDTRTRSHTDTSMLDTRRGVRVQSTRNNSSHVPSLAAPSFPIGDIALSSFPFETTRSTRQKAGGDATGILQ